MATTYSGVQIGKLGDFETLSVQTFEIRDLKAGEVLVKVEYSTVNPIDIMVARGYRSKAEPLSLGLEGSGTVVKSGGGELADSYLNRRVAFSSLGTWAEYAIAQATSVFPLNDSVSFRQAASFTINPFTVAAFIEKIQTGGHKAVIINAAASAVGKIVIRWGKKFDVPIIALVRKQEQVDLLTSLGAEHVFNTSDSDWKSNAKAASNNFGASIGFDCIGGGATNDLAELLQEGGVVYVYGSLSKEAPRIELASLLGQSKRLEGISSVVWLNKKDLKGKLEVSQFVQSLYDDIFNTEFSQEVNLNGLKDAIYSYTQNPTNNKILIRTTVD
jgi:NADPH:quinone reductase